MFTAYCETSVIIPGTLPVLVIKCSLVKKEIELIDLYAFSMQVNVPTRAIYSSFV